MHVVAIHDITDPERFYTAVEAGMKEMPPGMKVRTLLPSTDGSKAVCHWEAESVESVRTLVDGTTRDASNNQFFEAKIEDAIGVDV
jgi:hypothetical protein